MERTEPAWALTLPPAGEIGIARSCACSPLGRNRNSSALQLYLLAFTQLLTKAHTPQEKWDQLRTVVPKSGPWPHPPLRQKLLLYQGEVKSPEDPCSRTSGPSHCQGRKGQWAQESLLTPGSGQQNTPKEGSAWHVSDPKGRLSPTHEQIAWGCSLPGTCV